MNINEYSTSDLLKLQTEIITVLKSRDVIRTKNIKGDIGEYLTVEFLKARLDIPNLKLTKTGNKHFDAIDEYSNTTYTIKTITTSSTSCFYGLQEPESLIENEKIFDFLIITELNPDWTIKRMLKMEWKKFLVYKSWHSTMRAWKITLNKSMINDIEILTE